MAVTRFYLPSTGAAAVSPSFTLSGFSWTDTTQADRFAAVTTKISSSLTDKICNGTGGNGIDQLFRQYVSAPIPAQTISGTVKGQIRALEEVTSNDARAQIVVYVVSNDGSTLRGVLYPGDTAALSSEFTNTGRVNRKFPRGGAQALSSVSCSANDRIVIEIGARRSGISSTQVYLVFGDTGTDLPEDETTSSGCPWVEFSADLFNPSVSASATMSSGTMTFTGKALTGASAQALATVSDGTLTLTGQAMAAARYAVTATVAQGTLTLTGKALTGASTEGYAALPSAATITLIGQDLEDASWDAPDTAVLSRGTLTFTGKALTGASAEVLALVDGGTLTLVGQDATGRADVLATVAQGALTINGQSLLANAILSALMTRGTLTMTGKDFVVSAAASTTIARGTLTMTGVIVIARQGFSFYQVHII